MRNLGKFAEWKQQADALPAAEVQQMYERGFAGVWSDTESDAEFDATITGFGGSPDGAVAGAALAGSGAGKLTILFPHVERCFPNCWPGPAQQRGDCVSKSQANANLVTMCCEIVAGTPDEVHGRPEIVPLLPPEGILQGVLSSEWIYWWRRHGGDGWHCGEAATVSVKEAGCVLRKDYPGIADVTRYSGKTAGKYGSKTPPADVKAIGTEHLIRTATRVSGADQVRDFLANGYGISSCGSEGFSSTRNEDGVSNRKGSWAHAMAYIGFDDRPETIRKYGGPLVLILNSWGVWNRGPRTIMGTSIEIPRGSFWARWKDVSRRTCYAMSSVNGWPQQTLPDYGYGWA